MTGTCDVGARTYLHHYKAQDAATGIVGAAGENEGNGVKGADATGSTALHRLCGRRRGFRRRSYRTHRRRIAPHIALIYGERAAPSRGTPFFHATFPLAVRRPRSEIRPE
jgi:hypothetical protein